MICFFSAGSARAILFFAAIIATTILVYSDEIRASNSAPPFTLGSIQCEALDTVELTRILHLELSSIENVEKLPPLAIDITCDESRVIVTVTDPEKTQKIERSVPVPGNLDKGRERQIALTIAQFAGALWRLREQDLTLTPESAGPPVQPSNAPEEPVVESSVLKPETVEKQRLILELGGGMRTRTLGSSGLFVAGFGETSFVYPMGSNLAFVAALDVEGSRASRIGGEVGALAITAGMGLSGLFMVSQRFHLDGRFLLFGGYARFEGRADDPSAYSEQTSSGGAGEARLELAPTLLLGSTNIGLCIEGGYGLRVVVAEVSGDENLSFGGWWAGAGIRVGFGFGG